MFDLIKRVYGPRSPSNWKRLRTSLISFRIDTKKWANLVRDVINGLIIDIRGNLEKLDSEQKKNLFMKKFAALMALLALLGAKDFLFSILFSFTRFLTCSCSTIILKHSAAFSFHNYIYYTIILKHLLYFIVVKV